MVHRKFRDVKRKDKEAKKKKRNQLMVSIVFVGLMVVSILGVYVSNQQTQASNRYEYQDFTFDLVEQTAGQYALSTTLDGEEKIFYALPQDTLRIPVEGNLTEVIGSTGYLALASNPSVQAAPLIDLIRFDFDRYGHVLAVGVPLATENSTGISCLNATAQIPVITLVESNRTEIVINDSCVQIETKVDDLYLVRDRLLYSILKIINK
ncbi:MAG: hypothetical protein KC535_06240 [Nanoarchaeota archaeon]|nr:hypothetical protein [Nanoarchaeota archaeon]